jgi:TetR/AcrR family transcriptional regulator, multidrug resistance operon repressor
MRTRDEIKETSVRTKAIEMLVNEGFDGFSMQKLARAAGVSPATLYIYYHDKDDLIVKLGVEEGQKMTEATFQDFDPALPFAEGLRIQWRNRAAYCIANPIATRFFEQISHSPYRDRVTASFSRNFHDIMRQFVRNAVQNKELSVMPLEVYWSVAFAPLYNLIKFHHAGKSLGGRDFTFSEALMNQTLDLVLKALKP